MSKGIFVVSLDTELAWGRLTRSDLQKYIPYFRRTRDAIHGILSLCERYEVSFTWAIVGRLLLRPPSLRDAYMWYGQDIVSAIMNCKVPQEIGCHSFSHIYYNSCSFREASFDLECCRNVFKAWGLAPRSFVFPGNKVRYLSLLKQYGFTCFRGPTYNGQFNKNFLIVTSPLRFLHRLFFGPPVVKPKIAAGLVNIPGCMLFRVPNFKNFSIWYKIFHYQVIIAKKGLLKAANNGMVFHLWFHPFNFGYRTKYMLSALNDILAFAVKLRNMDKIDILTMRQIAQRILMVSN